MSEKRRFSGYIVGTCSPTTVMSGPTQPESTAAKVNLLRPWSELWEQPVQSANRHLLKSQENTAPK